MKMSIQEENGDEQITGNLPKDEDVDPRREWRRTENGERTHVNSCRRKTNEGLAKDEDEGRRSANCRREYVKDILS
ncbi:hypothetical protein Csa_011368 [Cucumis sativus]|uniref:Uncharacterized protein n=1 Tax=Cucumis sativus TaxID=3659 RepID=A0A0A0L7N2_CUCSA|nr:hypothetical protein Csa_011368 [Cucumis sativus]